MADPIEVKYLRKDADHAEQWAGQLRARQQHLLAEAAKVGEEATRAEGRADRLRADAAALCAGGEG